jgi:hypothetical protein
LVFDNIGWQINLEEDGKVGPKVIVLSQFPLLSEGTSGHVLQLFEPYMLSIFNMPILM